MSCMRVAVRSLTRETSLLFCKFFYDYSCLTLFTIENNIKETAHYIVEGLWGY